jgi:hypothetical protein
MEISTCRESTWKGTPAADRATIQFNKGIFLTGPYALIERQIFFQ